MNALQRREVNCCCIYSSIFDSFEEIDDSDPERLRQEVQTRQRQIHFAAFKSSNLRAMKTTFIGKHILTPALLQSQIANSVSQTLLQFLPLHFQQFGGTLLKHILLIRR